MRLYGKKFLKNRMAIPAQNTIETRDAILWDILYDQRICRVKIQGSDRRVIARFPGNWEKTPVWLKPRNSVRITHIGGQRGKIELVGHGQVVPTPVAGTTFPTIETAPDSILEDCRLIECLTPRMAVLVRTGTYRIGGTVYDLGPISMLYGSDYQMTDGGTIEEIAGAIAIDPAPAVGQFRIDLISVGTDGVIDYTAGTSSSEDPVEPSLAASHIELGHVLIAGGATEITQPDINKEWQEPAPSAVTVTPIDNDLAWDELSTMVRVSVTDQYGNPVYQTGLGWYLILEIVNGNGTVSSPEEGSSATRIGGHTGPANNYYDFTYTRGHLDPGDLSPTLRGSVQGSAMIGTSYITLRDAGGDPM